MESLELHTMVGGDSRGGLYAEGLRRQVAVPLVREGRQLGVLFLDSDLPDLAGLENEAVLGAFINQIEAAVDLATSAGGKAQRPESQPFVAGVQVARPTMKVRRFPRNDVIFVDGEYLIKGLAGVIFWKLVREYERSGRTEFSNLELRLELSQTHPEKAENLESRLVMLIRRLRDLPDLRIERIARGKFRLVIKRPLQLEEAG